MEERDNKLAEIEDVEIEALSDEDLDEVAGGSCSSCHCSNVEK